MAVKRGPGGPLWNGPPGASLPSFAALRKKVAPAGAKPPPSTPRPRRSGQIHVPVIAKLVRIPAVAIRIPIQILSRRNGQSYKSLRIRRSPLRFLTPSRRLRRPLSERTSLTPFPQNRNTAKTPYRSVAPPHSAREGSPLGTCALPHQIETVHFDLRRTFRRNLQASSREGTRRAAVGARSIWEKELRRIPVNKDAATAPLRSPRGLRRTGDPAKGGGMGLAGQAYALKHAQHNHRPEGFPLRATRMISHIVPLLTLLLKAARSFL